MDKPLNWTSLDGTQSFTATLHLSGFGAFKSADVSCRKMQLTGLNQYQFLQLIYEGIGARADSYELTDASAPPSTPSSPTS